MQALQKDEVRKLVKAYRDRAITAEEFREEIEWYWDRKIHKGTRVSLLTGKGGQGPGRQSGHGMLQREP